MTLMSQNSGSDDGELATKEFVRTESALTRAELHTEMADLRTELRTGLADVRAELRTGLADGKSEMADLRTELRTGLADVRTGMAALETRLLDKFHHQNQLVLSAVGVATAVIVAAGRF
jgi:ribosomal protein L29